MTAPAWVFLRQFLTSPRSVGAILPSSAALAEAMVAPIDFAKGPTIVEFGPGTGAFTRTIAQRLRPPGRYLGIELNEAFCETLAAEFPDRTFVHGSVADLTTILAQHGIDRVDAIVCGLPWASLPIALQERVFGEIHRALVPGGAFMTFAYLHGLILPGAQALRQRLSRSFASVTHSPTVWANVPPAFAYICRTGA